MATALLVARLWQPDGAPATVRSRALAPTARAAPAAAADQVSQGMKRAAGNRVRLRWPGQQLIGRVTVKRIARGFDEFRQLDPPYTPTAWIGMIHRQGAAEAAKRLLVNGGIQSGFERLIKLGRADLNVEQAVLNSRWSALFTDDHRAAARWRLEQV